MEHGDSQLSLPGVAATEAPQIALDYLAATRKHHSSTKAKLEDVHIATLLGMPLRTWQHRKEELRGRDKKKKLGGYDWLEGVWPPGPDWHPSWEKLNGRARSIAEAQEEPPVIPRTLRLLGLDDDMAPTLYEATINEEGIVRVIGRASQPHRNGSLFGHLSVVAAGLSAFAVLDLHDGSLDGVVHWCRVLLHLISSANLA